METHWRDLAVTGPAGEGGRPSALGVEPDGGRHRITRIYPRQQRRQDRSPYPFSSLFSSLRKRQSVPWAMIFCGLDLMIPASCSRSA